jgi:large subunit ribosomal protein L7Ae
VDASGRGDAGDASRERWTDARAHFFMFSQAPSKKPAPAPAAIKAKQPKKEPKGPTNPLFERRPKNFGIGNSLPVKTPLNRYVKWPKYVRIQRQRRVLQKRLKVPPAVNQFNNTLDKNLATNLFKLLMKYRPEDAAQKKERLAGMAQAEAAGADVEIKKPVVVKFGINHITYLIEQGKAQLVVIAHDVDPVELVVWLPALCKQMNVPYCIVKGKARLGAVVHKKTATALALTAIKNEDKLEFSKLVEAIKASYNDVFQKTSRTWGGGIMGVKSQAKTAARERIIARELAQRATVKI